MLDAIPSFALFIVVGFGLVIGIGLIYGGGRDFVVGRGGRHGGWTDEELEALVKTKGTEVVAEEELTSLDPDQELEEVTQLRATEDAKSEVVIDAPTAREVVTEKAAKVKPQAKSGGKAAKKRKGPKPKSSRKGSKAKKRRK